MARKRITAVKVATSGPVKDETPTYEDAYPIAQSVGIMRKRRRARRDGKVAQLANLVHKSTGLDFMSDDEVVLAQ